MINYCHALQHAFIRNATCNQSIVELLCESTAEVYIEEKELNDDVSLHLSFVSMCLLAIGRLWFCISFLWRDKNIYCVFAFLRFCVHLICGTAHLLTSSILTYGFACR